ncbi:MAG TPA: hypothetical protein DCL77_11630 [Prolixibacteraceae bacterium]|jgi:hypothetical protein|nr:hypothetical protein [Prolixibacteraceae bacterium]
MKTYLFVLLMFPIVLFSQEKPDTIKTWNYGGLVSLNFTQISLSNWAAGGQSSTAGVGILNVFANYKEGNRLWENSLYMGYGMIKEKDNKAIKSDDRFELNSKYGIKKTETLYYSALFNFKTQFAPGYKYPNTTDAISQFLAPAYLTLSVGVDYKPNKAWSFFVSPLTGKMTIVSDDVLSAQGAFGVDPGKKVRMEVGALVKIEVKTDIMKNVSLDSKVDMFSSYVNNPENIDINWDFLLNMKINEFLSANLMTNLIYDDDIKIPIDKNNDGVIEKRGPRVQFKELFGLGLNYKF